MFSLIFFGGPNLVLICVFLNIFGDLYEDLVLYILSANVIIIQVCVSFKNTKHTNNSIAAHVRHREVFKIPLKWKSIYLLRYLIVKDNHKKQNKSTFGRARK